MTVFFALSVLVGITIIIFEELADTSTVGILWIIVSCVVYMILHEGLHLFFMRIFSKRNSGYHSFFLQSQYHATDFSPENSSLPSPPHLP